MHQKLMREKFMLWQIFISGLREHIQTKVMEADKATNATYTRYMEVILNDRKTDLLRLTTDVYIAHRDVIN